MAPPDQLARKPESIGKPVRGVCARILNEADQEVGEKAVGRLCIRSAWTTSKKHWIETGDLAFRDAEVDIFLCGRVDDMIVEDAALFGQAHVACGTVEQTAAQMRLQRLDAPLLVVGLECAPLHLEHIAHC